MSKRSLFRQREYKYAKQFESRQREVEMRDAGRWSCCCGCLCHHARMRACTASRHASPIFDQRLGDGGDGESVARRRRNRCRCERMRGRACQAPKRGASARSPFQVCGGVDVHTSGVAPRVRRGPRRGKTSATGMLAATVAAFDDFGERLFRIPIERANGKQARLEFYFGSGSTAWQSRFVGLSLTYRQHGA